MKKPSYIDIFYTFFRVCFVTTLANLWPCLTYLYDRKNQLPIFKNYYYIDILWTEQTILLMSAIEY
jgi:hypothetical protein